MNKKDIISFFDKCAPIWDAEMIRDDRIIDTILDNCGVRQGLDVLDVACGTGVLFEDYVRRNVNRVTGVDISPEMIKIANSKIRQITGTCHNAETEINAVCADIENIKMDEQFDCCVVYNAFPHFPDGERLIEVLVNLLKRDGKLTVAHGMAREKINAHHSGSAHSVSLELMEADSLAEIFAKYCRNVSHVISNDEMYQVVGVK